MPDAEDDGARAAPQRDAFTDVMAVRRVFGQNIWHDLLPDDVGQTKPISRRSSGSDAR